ncbi:MAG: asparagine synthase C-terminal domain-containing protein [Pseudomonadota bacterium]
MDQASAAPEEPTRRRCFRASDGTAHGSILDAGFRQGDSVSPDEAFFSSHFAYSAADTPQTPIRGVTFDARPFDSSGRVERLETVDETWTRHLDRALEKNRGKAVAVALSGGLDSLLAASRLTRRRDELADLRVVSWSLNAFPDADESSWIQRGAGALGIPVSLIDLSHLAPGGNIEALVDADWPGISPFAAFYAELFKRCRDEGMDTLVSGAGGDDLMMGYRYRLFDALSNARWATARTHLRTAETSFVQELRTLVRTLLRQSPRRSTPAWLTAEAAAMVSSQPVEFEDAPRRDFMQILFGKTKQLDELGGERFAARFRMERHDPFHDWSLRQLAFDTPAYQLMDERYGKTLWRRLLGAGVPEDLRMKPRTGLLHDVFRRGIFEAHRKIMLETLFHGGEEWPRYVRREVIEQTIQAPESQRQSVQLLVWQCACFEVWLGKIRALNAQKPATSR